MLNELIITNAKKFTTESTFVIAGCHSLIQLEGNIGDPLKNQLFLPWMVIFESYSITNSTQNR